ncbi:MAG: electron transport complex subunit E [Ruminococcaceae bacterium]|nr:electron transport complex subunit E [Oscillospiraceae bacterium]
MRFLKIRRWNTVKNNKYLNIFTNGLIKENPTLRLVLGTCPTLAVTTAAINGIGMGISATVVLVCSNLVISLLRNIIPDKVRIPAFITIIAGFVSVVQMLVKAFLPSIDESLGIFLPLIVVNCIILARAEMFASKNGPVLSILDGLGMGIGFTAVLTLMGAIREFFGAGSIFSLPITADIIDPMIVFLLPPGGFFVFGILVAVSNAIAKKNGKKPVQSLGCANCPSRNACSRVNCEEEVSSNE